MPTINQLTAVDAVQAGDLIPIFSQANGDARKTSLTTLAAFIKTLITSTDDKQTQYLRQPALALLFKEPALAFGLFLRRLLVTLRVL
jgi:hypothetical protein